MPKLPFEEIKHLHDITPIEWSKCFLEDIQRVPGFGPASLWNMEIQPMEANELAPANMRRMTVNIPSARLILEFEDQLMKLGTPSGNIEKIKDVVSKFWTNSRTLNIVGMAAPSLQCGAVWLKESAPNIAMIISLIEGSRPDQRKAVLGAELAKRYKSFNLGDMHGVSLKGLLDPVIAGIDAVSPLPGSLPKVILPVIWGAPPPSPFARYKFVVLKPDTVVYHCAWGLGRTGMILCCYMLFDYYLSLYKENKAALKEYISIYTRTPAGTPTEYNPNAIARVKILIHSGHSYLTMPGTAVAVMKTRLLGGAGTMMIPACEVPDQIYALEMLESALHRSLDYLFKTEVSKPRASRGFLPPLPRR